MNCGSLFYASSKSPQIPGFIIRRFKTSQCFCKIPVQCFLRVCLPRRDSAPRRQACRNLCTARRGGDHNGHFHFKPGRPSSAAVSATAASSVHVAAAVDGLGNVVLPVGQVAGRCAVVAALNEQMPCLRRGLRQEQCASNITSWRARFHPHRLHRACSPPCSSCRNRGCHRNPFVGARCTSAP